MKNNLVWKTLPQNVECGLCLLQIEILYELRILEKQYAREEMRTSVFLSYLFSDLHLQLGNFWFSIYVRITICK
jgi:hypothetical protein